MTSYIQEMKKIIQFCLLLSWFLSFSQRECKLVSGNLFVSSSIVKDTIHLNISLKNKVNNKFEKSNQISVSFINKTHSFDYERYTLDVDDETVNDLNENFYFYYNIIKYCLLDYQISYFYNNYEQIEFLLKKGISFYYYRLNVTIIPKLPKD